MKQLTTFLALLMLLFCQGLFAGEPSQKQLKLPDFPEGTAPSEKAKKYLSHVGNFEKGILVERHVDKSGKLYLAKSQYYKLPDDQVTWSHLEHMEGGFVIAFNEFIPLPKFQKRRDKRVVSFVTDRKRQKNSFQFGRNIEYESITIRLKENTENTKYLMKNFAYKFKDGGASPSGYGFSSMTYLGADDNPIESITSYWKLGSVNNADFARLLTKYDYLDPDSKPYYAYFAPKGKTALEAMRKAEANMKKAEEEYLKRVKDK